MPRLPGYRTSGRVSPAFLALALVAMAACAALAWGYQLLITWVPYIYINLFIYIALAGVVAVAAYLIGRRGRNRNRWVGALVGGLIGVAAVGASHHVAYRRVVDELVEHVVADGAISEHEARAARATLEQELPFGRYVDARVAGGWSLGERSPGESGDLTGVMVWIIWGIEASGLFLAGVIGGSAQVPYCETCRRWTAQHEVATRRDVTAAELSAIAAASSVDALLNVPSIQRTEATPFRLSYTTSECDGCDGDAYLTLTKEWMVPGKKEDEPELRTEILQNLIAVPRGRLAKLRADLAPDLPDAQARLL